MSTTASPQPFTRGEVEGWPPQKRYQYIQEHFNRIQYAYASKMGVDSEIVSILYGCLLVGSGANDVEEKLALMERLIGYSNRITFFASLIVRRARPEQCDLENRFWVLTNDGKSYPCCMAPRSVDYGVLLYHTCRMLQCLCYDKNVDVRTQAQRTIRYQCMSIEGTSAFLDLGLDVVVTMSVLSDNRHMSVRVQAQKQLRHVLDVFPPGITRNMGSAILCVAENGRDEFRRIALDTLRAFSLARPVLFASLGCLNVIFDAALDPSLKDLTQVCVLLVLSFLDHPQTRMLVDPYPLVSRCLSAFTDLSSVTNPQREQLLLQHITVTVNTLHSYPGQVQLASHATGLQSLATVLTFPYTPAGQVVQRSILALLRKIICKVNSQDVLTVRKHLEVYHEHFLNLNALILHEAQILRVLLKHGFVDAQVTLLHHEHSPPEAKELLAEILRLSVCLLPKSELCRKLGLNTDTIPNEKNAPRCLANQRVIEDVLAEVTAFLSTGKDTPGLTPSSSPVVSNSVRSSIEQNIPSWCAYNINMGSLMHLGDAQLNPPFLPWITSDRPEPTNAELLTQKSSMYQHASDLVLNNQIKKTGVLLGKDVTAWDWDALLQYVEGPLQLPGPFHLTVKTKFCKRILSYSRPEKKGFVNLSWGISHTIVRKVVLCTVRAHLHTQEGRMSPFLLDLYLDCMNCFTAEVAYAASLQQKQSTAYILQYQQDQEIQKINLVAGVQGRSTVFTKHALSNSCSRDLISVLCQISTARGMSIDISKFWDSLASLASYISHDYLSRLVLHELDFQNSAEARALLHHWCVAGSTFLRRHMATVQYVYAKSHVSNLTLWAVDVQIALLHAPDTQVTLIALAAQEIMCAADHGCLSFFIARCPKLNHFGPFAHGIHMLLLTTVEGTDWLLRNGWLQHKLATYQIDNVTTDVVSLALANCFNDAIMPAACVTSDYSAVLTTNPGFYESPDLPCYSLGSIANGCSSFIPAPNSHDGYLLQQLLKTPWNVELVQETAQSRIAPVLTDVYLTVGVGDAGVPVQRLGNNLEDLYIAGESATAQHAAMLPKTKYFLGEVPGSPAMYVVANIVDTNNHPSGFLIDAASTLHAKLRVGAHNPSTPSLSATVGNRKKTIVPDVPGCWLKNPADVALESSDVEKISADGQISRSLPMQRRVLLRSQHSSDHMQTQYSEQHTQTHGDNWQEGDESQVSAGDNSVSHECTVPVYGENTFYMLDGTVRWNFTETSEGLLLTSVWFRLPPSADTVPGTSTPSHLFSFQPHTARGVQLLEESGILQRLADKCQVLLLQQQGSEVSDTDTLGAVVRNVLHAVGELGKTPRGFQLLQQYGLVTILFSLASDAQVLTLRGCAMSALSCIASTELGSRYLRAHGWDVVAPGDPMSIQCFAAPTQIDPFLCSTSNTNQLLHDDLYATSKSWQLDPLNTAQVKDVPTVGLNSVTVEFPETDKLLKQVHNTLSQYGNQLSDQEWETPPVQEALQHILGLISNLANSVGQKSTLVRLKALKVQVPLLFKNVRIFASVFQLLCAHTMKLGARRYILTELFELDTSTKDIDYLAIHASEYKYQPLP